MSTPLLHNRQIKDKFLWVLRRKVMDFLFLINCFLHCRTLLTIQAPIVKPKRNSKQDNRHCQLTHVNKAATWRWVFSLSYEDSIVIIFSEVKKRLKIKVFIKHTFTSYLTFKKKCHFMLKILFKFNFCSETHTRTYFTFILFIITIIDSLNVPLGTGLL